MICILSTTISTITTVYLCVLSYIISSASDTLSSVTMTLRAFLTRGQGGGAAAPPLLLIFFPNHLQLPWVFHSCPYPPLLVQFVVLPPPPLLDCWEMPWHWMRKSRAMFNQLWMYTSVPLPKHLGMTPGNYSLCGSLHVKSNLKFVFYNPYLYQVV